uniref:hypothetical protein n=1 Tax=[Ruminococcus] lactaris TaxID=46228 RepID=UPI00242CAFDD
IQGIECMVGAYEVYADAIFKLESADGVFKITPWICKKASEITNNAIGSAYKALSYSLTPPTSAGWRYISSMGFDPAHPCANFPDGLDANSNTGYRAGFYSENATNALREWLAVGYLRDGADAALGCANSNNGLGNARWNISGRVFGEQSIYTLRHIPRECPKIELKPARPRVGRGEAVGLVRC